MPKREILWTLNLAIRYNFKHPILAFCLGAVLWHSQVQQITVSFRCSSVSKSSFLPISNLDWYDRKVDTFPAEPWAEIQDGRSVPLGCHTTAHPAARHCKAFIHLDSVESRRPRSLLLGWKRYIRNRLDVAVVVGRCWIKKMDSGTWEALGTKRARGRHRSGRVTVDCLTLPSGEIAQPFIAPQSFRCRRRHQVTAL